MDKRIMVVDDDADIIEIMKAVLEEKGCKVETANSGAECLKKFPSYKPDVLFLDLMMESVDSGISVCKKIREQDKEVKIYLLSSVGDTAAGTIDIGKIGFNGAMSKPVKAAELLKLVE